MGMYPGSTTGPSHDNTVCSPYAITWHVDKACHQVPPESFDKLCEDMEKLYGMEKDLYPHGSRRSAAATGWTKFVMSTACQRDLVLVPSRGRRGLLDGRVFGYKPLTRTAGLLRCRHVAVRRPN